MLQQSAASAAAQAISSRPLRAVEYLRVSTREQKQGYGIASQQKKTSRHIASQGWEHAGSYADEGFSGSLEMHERPSLMRLMQDAQKNHFDVVVVKEGRAIGRTGRAFWRWVWMLEDMGIYVAIASTGTDNTTPAGQKEMRRQADYAESEWTTIRERTQDGLQEKAEEGGWIGGPPPYGYKIAFQGQKKLSRLVIDDEEAKILRLAWTKIVKDRMNTREAAVWLNSQGHYTRSGKPWRQSNLRARITSDAVMRSVSVFRHPGRITRTGKRSANTQLRKDGTPINGETVSIPLDPIFTPPELAALQQALTLISRGKYSTRNIYPLTGLIVNPCGAHAAGFGRTSGKQYRWYSCSGKTEKYAGASDKCQCPVLDAASIERVVWEKVTDLLGSPEKLEALAQEWIDNHKGATPDHDTRIEVLSEQITRQERVVSAVMGVSAKEAALTGKDTAEIEEAVRAAVAPLNEELNQMRSQHREAVEWQKDSAAADEFGDRLRALASTAMHRLHSCTPEEQREYLLLLDIKVFVTGVPVAKRKGRPCTLREWFVKQRKDVPEPLSDEAWERVSALMPPKSKGTPYRTLIDGMLHKVRTGARWTELPAVYGNPQTIHTRCTQWLKSGLWARVMEGLEEESTQPLPEPETAVPPLHIQGGIDPRLFAVHELSDPNTAGNALEFKAFAHDAQVFATD